MKSLSKIHEKLFFDVSIVGGGISGLSAAIRLKQLDRDLEVCVIEKALNIGDHVLSGCVFSPRALFELIPNWESMNSPITTKVTSVTNLYLTESRSFSIPNICTPWFNLNDHYVISLGDTCRWLKDVAISMDVRIFEGFSAKHLKIHPKGYIEGIITAPFGLTKDFKKTDSFQDSLEILSKQTFFAEGPNGLLSSNIIEKYKLSDGLQNLEYECRPQSFSLGLKEVWEIPELDRGKVINTYNWPLSQDKNRGFLYMTDTHLHIGLVVGLDYRNPTINAFREFQRFKAHNFVRKMLEKGKCVEFGAKIIDDGGFFSVPKLSFPGGMILGAAGSLTNPMNGQGAHTAMKSGMIAAEALVETAKNKDLVGEDIKDYYQKYLKSWIFDELFKHRHFQQAFNRSAFFGLFYSCFFRNRHHQKSTFFIENSIKGDNFDARDVTDFVVSHKKIEYKEPDNIISFDQEKCIEKSNHIIKDQPEFIFLRKGCEKDAQYSAKVFAGIEEKICPTGVFTYNKEKLEINSNKCILCGACKIKSTRNIIDWNLPDTGTGPQ